MQRSLAASSWECANRLTSLTTVLRDTQVQSRVALSQVSFEDQSSRFNLWAGNLGAFQALPSSSSLDYRLRESPRIAVQIQQLLQDLADALENVRAIAMGERPNRQYNSDEDDDADSEFEGILDTDGTPDATGDNSPDPEPQFSESEELFESVKETIASLFRISIIIRKATPRDRFAKALSSRENQFDDRFDVSHVAHKFPVLNAVEKQWLKERLGKAISQRRQYLRYAREHRNKLGTETKELWQPNVEQDERTKVSAADSTAKSQAAKTNLTSTLSPTIASTLHLTDIPAPELEVQNDQSVTSYALSLGEEADDSLLQVPRLVDVSKGSATFECPLCWTIQSIKRESTWRKHVFSDLRPYLCTFEKCDLKLFADRREWFDHELHYHRPQWCCAYCSANDFHSLSKFEHHLRYYHAKDVTNDQLDALTEASRRPVDRIPASDCPFCDGWDRRLRGANQGVPSNEIIVVTPKQFRRHVGSHMQQLALFAIPRGYLEGDAEANSAASVAAAGVANASLLDSEDQSIIVDDATSSQLESSLPGDDASLGSQASNDIYNTPLGLEARQEALIAYLKSHLTQYPTVILRDDESIKLFRKDGVLAILPRPYNPDVIQIPKHNSTPDVQWSSDESFAEYVKTTVSEFYADPISDKEIATIFSKKERYTAVIKAASHWLKRTRENRGRGKVEKSHDHKANAPTNSTQYSDKERHAIIKRLTEFLEQNMPAGYTARLIDLSIYIFTGPGYTYRIDAPFTPLDVRYEGSEEAKLDASFNYHLQVVRDWVQNFREQQSSLLQNTFAQTRETAQGQSPKFFIGDSVEEHMTTQGAPRPDTAFEDEVGHIERATTPFFTPSHTPSRLSLITEVDYDQSTLGRVGSGPDSPPPYSRYPHPLITPGGVFDVDENQTT